MKSAFGGRGRPSKSRLERERKEFVRLVLAGESFAEARRRSEVGRDRGYEILDELREAGLLYVGGEEVAA